VGPLTAAEVEHEARAQLPQDTWDFIQGGSGSERTLAANLAQFGSYALRPRVLVGVAECDSSLELLGDRLAAPIGVAPMAYHRLAHPEGELATARATGRAGMLLVAGIFASRTLEQIAAVATGPLWLQLYWLRRREVLESLIGRAEAAGYRALVLTVDAPRIGRRLRDVRSGFTVPDGVRAVNLDPSLMAASHRRTEGASGIEAHAREQFDPALTWADLSWLIGRSSLPLVLKGILTAEDARRAVDCGAAAVVVSNHGGRQLDGAPPTLAVLPEVVAAVPPDFPVLVDGGVRQGSDVAIALALGARAVLVGRPVLWGLARAGEAGVEHLLGLLRSELDDVMALSGRPRLCDFDLSAVARWDHQM